MGSICLSWSCVASSTHGQSIQISCTVFLKSEINQHWIILSHLGHFGLTSLIIMGWKVVESEAVLEATQLHHHSNIYLNLEQIRFNDRLDFFYSPRNNSIWQGNNVKRYGKIPEWLVFIWLPTPWILKIPAREAG